MARPFRLTALDLFWVLLPSATVLVVLAAIMIIPLHLPKTKVSLLCDEAVHQVLTTKDPVELQRAIFLVNWFNCAVGRRLP